MKGIAGGCSSVEALVLGLEVRIFLEPENELERTCEVVTALVLMAEDADFPYRLHLDVSSSLEV